MQTTQLFGYQLVNEKMTAVVDHLDKHLHKNKNLILIATPNPEQIVQTKHDASFAQNLTQFDYLLPDGIGLVWASQTLSVFGQTSLLLNRLAGVDVVVKLIESAWQHQQTVLLIGGQNFQLGEHQLAGQKFNLVKTEMVTIRGAIKKLTPDRKTLYWWAELSADDAAKKVPAMANLQAVLSQVKPDLVFVAYGAPYQEAFLVTQRQLLAANHVKLGMAVGGSFDILLGQLRRAPQWMQSLGLEWLYRLIQEPWRWRRQLRLIEFVWLVFRQIFA